MSMSNSDGEAADVVGVWQNFCPRSSGLRSNDVLDVGFLSHVHVLLELPTLDGGGGGIAGGTSDVFETSPMRIFCSLLMISLGCLASAFALNFFLFFSL